MPGDIVLPAGPWFDSHAHVYLYDLFDEKFGLGMGGEFDLALRLVHAAEEAGVCGILCPGIDWKTNRFAIELARRCPGKVWAAVGIHPNSVGKCHDSELDRVQRLSSDPVVKAIGETGLDRYHDDTPWDAQCNWFRGHLELAVTRNLPVIVHCRDAEEEITPILREYAGRGLRGVMHACAASWEYASQWLELGLYLSFAGSVTYRNRKFDAVRETARRVPLDRILVETDAPFLIPEPLRGRVSSCYVQYVALTGGFLAELRGMTSEDFAAQTRRNAETLFGLTL